MIFMAATDVEDSRGKVEKNKKKTEKSDDLFAQFSLVPLVEGVREPYLRFAPVGLELSAVLQHVLLDAHGVGRAAGAA